MAQLFLCRCALCTEQEVWLPVTPPKFRRSAPKGFCRFAPNFLFDTFCRHVWPKVIQSDQGREFVNEVNTRLFQLTDIQHCVSSAYHPQTNGLDERFNQTLVNTLKKVIDSGADDWDQHALYAYCISKQVTF